MASLKYHNSMDPGPTAESREAQSLGIQKAVLGSAVYKQLLIYRLFLPLTMQRCTERDVGAPKGIGSTSFPTGSQ